VHHVGISYDQFMMHGQRNIKLKKKVLIKFNKLLYFVSRTTECYSGCVMLSLWS